MRLSEDYYHAFIRMIEEAQNAVIGETKKYSALWPMIGNDFVSREDHSTNRGLLIVGRATNGWTTKVGETVVNICGHQSCPMEATEAARRTSELGPEAEINPITWVTECWGNTKRRRKERVESPYTAGAVDSYNTRYSQFWNVAHQIVRELLLPRSSVESANGAWIQKVAWTNLYKVAPKERGNPGERLRKGILDSSIKLINLEINAIRPEYILVVTGLDWAEPFLKALGKAKITSNPKDMKYVEAMGTIGSSRVIVAVHPQSRPRAGYVSEVKEAFKAS